MFTAHGITHPGNVRKNNEDAFFVDETLGLVVVADGMGGHNAGEVASHLAIEAIRGFLERSAMSPDFTWPYGINPSLSFHGNRLMTSIKLANRRVFKAGESRDDYAGLGTTIVAALIQDGQISYSSVGDSRIYLLSGERLVQLTQDDSWIATVLPRDTPSLTTHPMRHVLTSAVGARGEVDVDVYERTLAPNDTFLFSTDGLHGALNDEKLAQQLASHPAPDAAAEALVKLALETDGRDNITAVVVRSAGDLTR